MTDEWFACDNCKNLNPNTKSIEEIESEIIFEYLSKFDAFDELNADDILILANRIESERYMSDEGFTYCNECKKWGDHILALSTED